MNRLRIIQIMLMLLTLALALPVATPAFAQSMESLSRKERKELDKHLDAARQAYETGNFRDAAIAFEKVYAIWPSADVLYRLALCYERLGETQKAIQAYRDYLVKRPDDPEKQRIEGVIRALSQRNEPKTSTLSLRIEPSDALVYIDGAQRLETPDEDGLRNIVVPVGEHEVKIVTDGFISDTRKLQFAADETYNLIVSLRPVVVEESSASTWGWVLAGSGAGAMVVGGIFVGMSMGMDNVLDELDAQRGTTDRPDNYEDLVDQRNAHMITGLVLTGVGVAATTVGVILLIPSGESATTAIAPTVLPGGGGAQATVRF